MEEPLTTSHATTNNPTQDTRKSLSQSLHEKLVTLLIVPFIDRFLGGIVGKSCETLHLSVPDVKYNTTYGGKKTDNNNESPLPVSLTILHPIHFCWLMLLDPKLGLGETYMSGDWTATPDPTSFLKLLIRSKKESARTRTKRKLNALQKLLNQFTNGALNCIRYIAWSFNYLQHLIKENTVSQSAKNIRDHYDLGNDMFEQFLDPSLMYSCALFEKPGVTVTQFDAKVLQEAQERKIDRLIERLELTDKDHVLEIGCGWGACAVRAVKRYGCKWTGLTISHEQLAWGQKLVKEEGLEHLVELKYLDYRLETGVYSKIISIEMIEAVGEKYLSQFFTVINERLAPGGRAVLQGIICPDAYYDNYCKSSDFIRKHIFPGGHLPSVGHILKCLPHGLQMGSRIDSVGRHYATTLDHWFCAWMANENEILELGYSDVFHRKWQFYFALCSALFTYDHVETIQFELNKAVY